MIIDAKMLNTRLHQPYKDGDGAATLAALLAGLKIGEHRVMLKKDFDTACWVPPVGKKAAHSIYYGDQMLTNVLQFFMEKLGLTPPEEVPAGKDSSSPATRAFNARLDWAYETLDPAQWAELKALMVKAVTAFGRHERAHALFTPQDLKKVTADLKLLKLPFSLFNLFEDARIEERERKAQGENLGWLGFEKQGEPTSPLGLFFRCIQLENTPDEAALASTTLLESMTAPWHGKEVREVAARVADYYQRTIACEHATELYAIMVEFRKEFGNPPPDESGKSDDEGEGDGDGEGSDSGESSGKGKSKGKGKGEEESKESSGSEGAEGSDASAESGDAEGAGGDTEGMGECDPGDLTTAAAAAEEGDKFFESFDSNAAVADGEGAEAAEAKAKAKAKAGKPPSSTKGSPAMGIPDSIGPVASGGEAHPRHFLSDRPGSIDKAFQARVDSLVTKLMRMFKTHSLNMATENPGHRLSGRHLAKGELRFIHKKVYGGKGKRKYSIVFDCSGSMNGYPAREGKLLLLALNTLAQRGYLEGSLILSGFPSGRPGWLRYAFPVKPEIILSITTRHSSEGLQASITDNLKHLKGMDDVFVYTDANICDTPINRAALAQSRIWPVGLYAGDAENESIQREMARHFPQNIIKDTIDAVVESMLIRNKRTIG